MKQVEADGYFARRDSSGRAVAATPAMNMVGSSIGPFLGGTLVKLVGYTSLGYAALVLGAGAVLSASYLGRKESEYQRTQAGLGTPSVM